MFARSSVALVALLSIHGIGLVDAKVGRWDPGSLLAGYRSSSRVGGSTSDGPLSEQRASQSTTAPTSVPEPTVPVPTSSPSDSPGPSPSPSGAPTGTSPTTSPSSSPAPSPSPSSSPSISKAPTPFPTTGPPTTSPVVTEAPSNTQQPSPSPSGFPSTPMPTTTPSDSPKPSPSPTRDTPTGFPTKTMIPSDSPTGSPQPSPSPTTGPTGLRSGSPSKSPAPTDGPTSSPQPSPSPTIVPTTSKMPAPAPTQLPTVSNEPSKTSMPSMTSVPSLEPSFSGEPSVSNVPSSIPSESNEPSISDVPTTSNNPTVDRDVAYVDVTVTWQGDSTVRFFAVETPTDSTSNAGIECSGAVSVLDTGTFVANPVYTTDAGVVGDPAKINIINIKCPFGVTTDLVMDMYQIAVVQETASGGTNVFYDLTVDYKVDGETVPSLSGVFKNVETNPAANTVAFDPHTFTFTNHDDAGNDAGEVVAVQVSPARNANFLTFEMTAMNDQIQVTMLDVPALLTGGEACTGPTTASASVQFVCPAFTSLGGLYRFEVTVADGGTGTAGEVDEDIVITVLGDGVPVTPGFSIPAGTDLTENIQGVYEFRSDSIDGPFVAAQLDWPFLLTATAGINGLRRLGALTDEEASMHRSLLSTQILSLGSPAAQENCEVGGPTTLGSVTVWYIFCQTYASGGFVFFSADNDLLLDFELSYDGAVDPDLSSSDDKAATHTFSFTAPEKQGDPLDSATVTTTTAVPSMSPAPTETFMPSPGARRLVKATLGDESMVVTGVNANTEPTKIHLATNVLDYHQYDFQTKSPHAPSCDAALQGDDVDFTLVTQFSLNRVTVMKHHCDRWKHRMSVAVATHRSIRSVTGALKAVGCNTDLITINTVAYDPLIDVDEDYPVNKLRNVAMSAVKTSHAVVVDADFVLSEDAYDVFTEQRTALAKDHKTALLIPAFELRSFCPDCTEVHEQLLPRTKEGLLWYYDGEVAADGTMLVEPTVSQFDSRGNMDGHGSTRYDDWVSQDAHSVLPIECINSDRYEPYLVVRNCADLPPFQEAFTGYGQNKLTWFQQLRRTGYHLQQLGGAFVVHFPHAKSSFFKKWERERRKMEDKSEMAINKITESFHSWMEDHVADDTVLPQCGRQA